MTFDFASSGTEAHRIGPKIGQIAFYYHFCMIMFVKYVYVTENDAVLAEKLKKV